MTTQTQALRSTVDDLVELRKADRAKVEEVKATAASREEVAVRWRRLLTIVVISVLVMAALLVSNRAAYYSGIRQIRRDVTQCFLGTSTLTPAKVEDCDRKMPGYKANRERSTKLTQELFRRLDRLEAEVGKLKE